MTSFQSRTLIAAAIAAAGLAAAPAMANTLTYQGVTFNTYAVDGDTLKLEILGATGATGDWSGIAFLKAFEIKDIGAVTGATVVSGPGSFVPDVDHGVAAATLGCGTGGTPGACFVSTPAVGLAASMAWEINFTGTGLDFSAPHVKVQFLESLTQTKPTGNLLSQTIPAVPEPETYAMFLAGLGMMGFVARRRAQRAE